MRSFCFLVLWYICVTLLCFKAQAKKAFLAFAEQMPLVFLCGKFFFQIFSEFWTQNSRYNFWNSARTNQFISNPVASISTEIYRFLTLITRTQYFTKQPRSRARVIDVKFCACDQDKLNFWSTFPTLSTAEVIILSLSLSLKFIKTLHAYSQTWKLLAKEIICL